MKNEMDTKWIFTTKLNHNKMYVLMAKVTIFILCLCIGWQCGTADSIAAPQLLGTWRLGYTLYGVSHVLHVGFSGSGLDTLNCP